MFIFLLAGHSKKEITFEKNGAKLKLYTFQLKPQT